MDPATASDSRDLGLEEFEPPDWDAPVDAEAHIESMPEDAMVKGMFLQTTMSELERIGESVEGFGPYRAFKDYTQRESARLAVAALPLIFPGVPLRRALRRLGWLGYPTLANTLIGRVIFGLVGSDPARVFRVAAKGYSVSVSEGGAESMVVEDNLAIVRLSRAYFFHPYHIGIFEGTLRHLGRTGEVLARSRRPFDIDLLIRWE